jgi:hypothetical protein
MRYVYRPIKVEAMQYTGDMEPVREWCKGRALVYGAILVPNGIIIDAPGTNSGPITPGKWIVRDPWNNYTVHTDEEFAERYAPAGG